MCHATCHHCNFIPIILWRCCSPAARRPPTIRNRNKKESALSSCTLDVALLLGPRYHKFGVIEIGFDITILVSLFFYFSCHQTNGILLVSGLVAILLADCDLSRTLFSEGGIRDNRIVIKDRRTAQCLTPRLTLPHPSSESVDAHPPSTHARLPPSTTRQLITPRTTDKSGLQARSSHQFVSFHTQPRLPGRSTSVPTRALGCRLWTRANASFATPLIHPLLSPFFALTTPHVCYGPDITSTRSDVLAGDCS